MGEFRVLRDIVKVVPQEPVRLVETRLLGSARSVRRVWCSREAFPTFAHEARTGGVRESFTQE